MSYSKLPQELPTLHPRTDQSPHDSSFPLHWPQQEFELPLFGHLKQWWFVQPKRATSSRAWAIIPSAWE